MSATTGRNILYPDSDGMPMAENTLQFQWIVTIQGGLDAQYRDDPAVFVAGDLLWYPVEGDPTIRQAPDALVAFGRPKGYRGSYMQWEEDGVAPQVVFEVLSPGNRAGEMQRKFEFYQRYGVEEYYLYDPDRVLLSGWLRNGDALTKIPIMQGWTSPRLGIRFELAEDELTILHPDGSRFLTYVESVEQREEEAKQRRAAVRARAREEKRRIAAEQGLADETSRREAAEQARVEETSRREAAEQARVEETARRAAAEQARVEEAARRAAAEQDKLNAEATVERLREQLRRLGIKPNE